MEKQLEFAAFAEERIEAADELEISEERIAENRYSDSLIALDTFRRAVKSASSVHDKNKWEHETARARHSLQDDRILAEQSLGKERAESLLRKAFAELAGRQVGFLVTEHDIKFALSNRLW